MSNIYSNPENFNNVYRSVNSAFDRITLQRISFFIMFIIVETISRIKKVPTSLEIRENIVTNFFLQTHFY